MAVTAFIPEIWNADLLVALRKSLVLADPGVTVNTDYEGDISEAGDTVHIGALADPTIKTYAANSTVIVPDALTVTDQTLVVDQAKYFSIYIDDVDKRQALGGGSFLTKAAKGAAYQMKKTIDTFVGTKFVAGAGNVLGAKTVVVNTQGSVYALLLEIKNKMDQADVPHENRWVCADPELLNQLYWDTRFTDVSAYGQNGVVANGEMGRVLGFTLKASTNMPVGATAAAAGNQASKFLIAGQGTSGMSYVQQINKTEAYRPESSFSDAIKGLAVYGAKVVRPEFVVTADVLIDVTP